MDVVQIMNYFVLVSTAEFTERYLLQGRNSVQEGNLLTNSCFSPPQPNVPLRKTDDFFLTKNAGGRIWKCLHASILRRASEQNLR